MGKHIWVIGWQIALEEKSLVHIRLDRGAGISAARHRKVTDIVPIAPQPHLAIQRLGVEALGLGERGIAQRLGDAMTLDEVKPDIFQGAA
jgi:hypothetical protein